MQKERKISFNWAATIALVIATLAITLFAAVYKLPQIYKYEKDLAGNSTNTINSEFLEKAVVNSEDDAPYLETGIDGYYYSANDNGSITFYSFSEGQYIKEKSLDTTHITLPGTNEKTAIYFISNGNTSVGFGVYSNKKSKKYPYAFLKVIKNNITDNYDYIAFVDNDFEDYYNNTKTYNQIYAFSGNGSDVKAIFDFKDSNTVIPVDLIMTRNDGFYCFVNNGSEYSYTLYYKNTISGGEVTYSKDIALPYAFQKGYDLLLIERDGDNLYLKKPAAIENTTVKKFSGDPSVYIVKGNYIYNKDSKVLYDVQKDSEKVVRSSISTATLEDYAVSSNGSIIVIADSLHGVPQLYFYDFSSNKLVTVDGKGVFLIGNSNLAFNGNYVLMVSPAASASEVINLVIPWESVK